MKLLLDTHILLWAAGQPEKLAESTLDLLTNNENQLFFSAASIWEIVTKLGIGRENFKVDPSRFRKMLVVHGYTEMPITAEHALRVEKLPLFHKDPFDRILVAQARVEGMRLLTNDNRIALYQEPVLLVK